LTLRLSCTVGQAGPVAADLDPVIDCIFDGSSEIHGSVAPLSERYLTFIDRCAKPPLGGRRAN